MGRETLIRATMASSLAWDDNHQKPVDIVTAIALSSKHNELGSLMLRVEALDAQSMRGVILLIIRRLNHKHHITRGCAERMAQSVLTECLQPHCPDCGGCGELHHDGEAVLTCTHCSGSGFRRYTDQDRLTMIGSPYNSKAYTGALGWVRDALREIVNGANNRLT